MLKINVKLATREDVDVTPADEDTGTKAIPHFKGAPTRTMRKTGLPSSVREDEG
jgi:hypothetical protein